jgi:pimeloyl-ACP methyl ester carboxylesterase
MRFMMKTIYPLLLMMLMNTDNSNANTYDFNVAVYGKGQAMILIPGLNSDGAVWDETVEHYKKNYQIHVLTLPGFAGVKPMDLSHGFLKPLSQQILAYIDSNKLENPIIMGHSLGGFMSLLLAIERPNLFKKIIIVDSAPFFAALRNPAATEENAKAMAQMMKKQMQNTNKEMASAQMDMMLPSMIKTKDKIPLAKKWGMQSDGATSSEAMYELMSTDLRDKISVIKSPILLLGAWVAYKNYGATRESVESNYTAQYSQIKDFEIQMTDIGHHFIMWDDPDFFFSTIDAFLKK